jgi:hypothetical protein
MALASIAQTYQAITRHAMEPTVIILYAREFKQAQNSHTYEKEAKESFIQESRMQETGKGQLYRRMNAYDRYIHEKAP